MTRPLPALLREGARLTIAGELREIERRAGTDQRPFVRVTGCRSREAADALRGEPLLVAREDLPALGEGEYWAHELEGCAVVDGATPVGTVRRMVTLPSCEALEVGDRLIPLVGDAIRSVDVAARRIDVDLGFLGEA